MAGLRALTAARAAHNHLVIATLSIVSLSLLSASTQDWVDVTILRDQLWWIGSTVLLALMSMIFTHLAQVRRFTLRPPPRPPIAWTFVYNGRLAAAADLVTLVALPTGVILYGLVIGDVGKNELIIGGIAAVAVASCGILLLGIRGENCYTTGPGQILSGVWERCLGSDRTYRPGNDGLGLPDDAVITRVLALTEGTGYMPRARAQEEAEKRWGERARLAIDGDIRYVGRITPSGQMEILGVGRNWAGAFKSADIAESAAQRQSAAPCDAPVMGA